jgi:hypothetical protein
LVSLLGFVKPSYNAAGLHALFMYSETGEKRLKKKVLAGFRTICSITEAEVDSLASGGIIFRVHSALFSIAATSKEAYLSMYLFFAVESHH